MRLDIRLFIMGDDNSGFTHLELPELERFVSFLAEYAKTRYHLKLSLPKCVITSDRDRIQTPSYVCKYGAPRRDINKFVAQLLIPENGINRKYMSYRALGMLYAPCGSDSTFDEFCTDVFYTFLPYCEPLTEIEKMKLPSYYPGQFNLLDDQQFLFDVSSFPELSTVQNSIRFWQGPLSFAPK